MSYNEKFIIKRSSDYQYYFVFKAKNGQTIVTSETYTQKHSCKEAIELLQNAAASADVEDETI